MQAAMRGNGGGRERDGNARRDGDGGVHKRDKNTKATIDKEEEDEVVRATGDGDSRETPLTSGTTPQKDVEE